MFLTNMMTIKHLLPRGIAFNASTVVLVADLANKVTETKQEAGHFYDYLAIF